MALSRICILFSDTGGGHRSAAEAIEAAVQEVAAKRRLGEPVEVMLDNGPERSHPVNRAFVELYNLLLRHRQQAMKYYHWFIEAFKPNDSTFGYVLSRSYIKALLERVQPAVVVSAHPMVNHYFARAISELGLKEKIKLIIVVTDPNANLWSGWGCRQADLIIAPNDLAADCLVGWGLPVERILVAGMPVHPKFLRPPTRSREEFLTNIGLRPEKITIFINAGWAGGGSMSGVYKALTRVNRPVQVVFGCGHNLKLFEKMKAAVANSGLATTILPFNGCMPDLMSASDLMVTKAGGLTTFEALARRLPMAIDLFDVPMPQEIGTAELLIAQKLAEPLRKPGDIISIVEKLRPEERHSRLLPGEHSLNRVDAVYQIAQVIVDALEPGWDAIQACRVAAEAMAARLH